jgi:hypothetical protein
MKRLPALWLATLPLWADLSKAPLPDAAQLRQKALAHMRQSASALERYLCSVETTYESLDRKGQVRKRESETAERFFVNGMEIRHVLARNGKPLSEAEARKQQNRADKQVVKYSGAANAGHEQQRREQISDIFLRAHRFTNGRRELRDGRSTLIYDLSPDPAFRPHTREEQFASLVEGRIWIDEESGALVEMDMRTGRDIKLAGGLLGNLHKGFHFQEVLARQPDGVWLEKEADMSGDVRAVLFVNVDLRFREQTGACRFFSVDAQDVAHSGAANQAAKKAPQ